MERRQFIKRMGIAGLGTSLLAATNELGTAHAQTNDVYLPSVMTDGDSAQAQAVDTTSGDLLALNNGTSGPCILVAAQNAPATVRKAAQYRCNGSNDQNTINQAINDLQPTGGLVQLSEGNFKCSGSIRVARRTMLFGRGRATILEAHGSWGAHDGSWPGAVIEPKDNGTDKTWIGSLAINGNRWGGADVQGLYYNITNKQNFDEGPDAAHYFTDLYIHATKRHAFHLKGNQNRGNKTARVRVWNPGDENSNEVAHGFFLECPDSYYLQCEAGSSSGSGFYVGGSNCHFVSCKGWYSDQSGWQIRSVRGNYSACEGQDNQEHGFYITSGPNSFTSCNADSNSWNKGNPQSSYDGFHLPWGKNIQLIGCSAYDKNESNRGNWQRHGFFMGSSCKHCQVIGTTRDNTASKLGGNVDQSQNTIMISG